MHPTHAMPILRGLTLVSLLSIPSRQCLQTQHSSYTLIRTHTPLLPVDASSTALGGVLQQHQDGQWCPLAFFSRKLSSAERNYSTFGRELLAIYSAIKHFRYFLEGRPFTVLTDHKPLCYSLATSSSRHSPREIRHLAFISEFTTDIQHISGVNNPVADALSRVDALTVPEQDLNLNQLGVDQQADPELQHLRLSPTCSLQWCEVSLPGAPQPLVCDFSTGTPRPYLPPAYRWAVFNTLHNTTHPGIRASRHLVASKYVWENMSRDVTAWTRSCVPCQRSKVHRHTAPNASALSSARFPFLTRPHRLGRPTSWVEWLPFPLDRRGSFHLDGATPFPCSSLMHFLLPRPSFAIGSVVSAFPPPSLRTADNNSSLDS